MTDPYKELLERLSQARIDAEMTQQQLADAMNVRQSTISDILNGRKHMGRKTLGAVLRVFPHLRPNVIAVLTSTVQNPCQAA